MVPLVSGLMFHFNCENDDVEDVIDAIDGSPSAIDRLLDRMDWVSLGGGISFTTPGYPLDRFADALRAFAERHGVQVYLEPGEAVVTDSAELVTTVLDVVHNEVDVAIVDASLDAHLPDQPRSTACCPRCPRRRRGPSGDDRGPHLSRRRRLR